MFHIDMQKLENKNKKKIIKTIREAHIRIQKTSKMIKRPKKNQGLLK